MDYKISQEQISKRICMNGIVNGFVAFMRENNFPPMSATRLVLDYAKPVMYGGHEMVICIYCTEEKKGDMHPFFEWKLADLMGETDEPFFDKLDEWSVTHFEGGGYAQRDRTFYIAVDGHLYFVTGEEYRKYNI